jgi:hypothetical protein
MEYQNMIVYHIGVVVLVVGEAEMFLPQEKSKLLNH